MVTDRGFPNIHQGNNSSPSTPPSSNGEEGVWKSVFDSVDCGLLLLSEPHQVILEANSALCRQWQIPRHELLGLRLNHVVSDDSGDSDRRLFHGRLQRGPAQGSDLQWRKQPLEGAAPGISVAVFSGSPADRREFAGDHDPTTRLANRQFLEAELARRLSASQSTFSPFALLFLDLDGFKAVNDSWGHLAGDDILRETSRRLAECVREKDLVARYGGDEFVVLAEGISDARAAARLARRISAALGQPVPVSASGQRRRPADAQLGVSIGLALATESGISPRSLLEKADRDMYRRKRLRRRKASGLAKPSLQN